MRTLALKVAAALFCAMLAAPALAAPACQNTGNFETWLQTFKKDAASQGVSQKVIAEAAPSMTFDPVIIKRDHGQAVFNQTFIQFSDRMIGGPRIPNGLAKIKQHAKLFAEVEKKYGVPAPVLTAFWGLESEFGGLQFTASDYLKNAVDFDGDGRRDLIKSIPDTMASGANFLVSLGWQRGQPWLQEVRVPENLPWQEADNTITHPGSQWVAWGVKPSHGSLAVGTLEASLILPMGRHGPAFLAYPNFKAFLGWNSAYVYSTTVAYLSL